MAPQYRPPHCSPCDSGERERGCPGDFQLCSRARGLLALRHPRGQRTDAARAHVLRIPRVRHHHGCQRYAARCLRLDQGATRRQHLTVVMPSRPQMRPTPSHAIPQRHGLTRPQKPHDSNGSVSNSEMLSWELHATFVELHPLWSITPDQWALHPIRTGAMLTDRVHALIDDKLYCGCASYAEWTPRLNPIPHTDAPAKATYDGPHRRVVGIRPQ